MPQPTRPRPTTPPQVQRAAATGGAAAATGAALAPAAAQTASVAAADTVVAAAVDKVVQGFAALLRKRAGSVYPYIFGQLKAQYPDRTPSELADLAQNEARYETMFRDKALIRLRRELGRAMRVSDPEARKRAVQSVIDQEKRFLAQREQAMLMRSQGAAEMHYLQQLSPQGAYWKLSEGVKEHTPDCLALGEKFWPWSVLRTYHPPMHNGCPCRLLGLDEAVRQGLMTPADVPDEADAMRRAQRVAQLVQEAWEFGIEEADVEAWVAELEEVKHTARWSRGTTKGGQFRPKRGGDPGRPTIAGIVGRGHARRVLDKLIPRLPESPAARRDHGRWAWIEGRQTRVPEGDWKRTIAGHEYSSPAGGTNIYRDGVLVAEDGHAPTHPSVRKPAGGRERRRPALAQPVEGKLAEALAAARAKHETQAKHAERKARVALRLADSAEPPVDTGDSVSGAIDGLHAAGFHPTGTRQGAVTLVHASGATVTLHGDRGRVAGVQWEPQPAIPLVPRSALRGRRPESMAELRSDALAQADQMGAQHGAEVHVHDVRTDYALGDHAGRHTWDGKIDLGEQVQADVERLAAKRAAGQPLTGSDHRAEYATAHAVAHEVAHGVNPIPSWAFDGANANLEEALTEEVAHWHARDRLKAWGAHDTVAWADQHPDALEVQGVYRPERAALARLLDDAGIRDPHAREALVERLKYKTDPVDRTTILAQALVDGGKFSDVQRALDHVELALEAPGPVDHHDAPTISAPKEPGIPDAPADALPPAPRTYDARVEPVREHAGATVAEIAAQALAGGQGAEEARWELARRVAEAPDSPGAAAIRQAVPDLPPDVAPAPPLGSQAAVDDFLRGAPFGQVMWHTSTPEARDRILSGVLPENAPEGKGPLLGQGFYASSGQRELTPPSVNVPVALRLEHPLVIDHSEGEAPQITDIVARAKRAGVDVAAALSGELQHQGYDGVVMRRGDGETWAVAFNPNAQARAAIVDPVRGPDQPSHGGLGRVAPAAGPGVGIRLDQARDGTVNTADGPLGRGAYFTSGSEESQAGAQAKHAYPAGVSLDGATLYRVRDRESADTLASTLQAINAQATDPETLASRLPAGPDGQHDWPRARDAIVQAWNEQQGPSAPSVDPATRTMQLLGYDGVDARHVPEWDTQQQSSVLYPPRTGNFDARDEPTHLVGRSEADAFLANPPEGAWTGIATHATTPEAADSILAGGFDLSQSRDGELGRGIYAMVGDASDPAYGASQLRLAVRLNNPHVQAEGGFRLDRGTLEAQSHDGAVVRHGDRQMVVAFNPSSVRVLEPDQPSPSSGGAVVGGRAGRWVWIRGAYRHIPHDEAWQEAVDGVRFRSPEGSTFVYRRVGDGPEELVAKPRWNGHPDVRDPRRGGTRRGGAAPPPIPPVTPPPERPAPLRAGTLRVGQGVRVTAGPRTGETAIVENVGSDGGAALTFPDGETFGFRPGSFEPVDGGVHEPQIGPRIGADRWTELIAAPRPSEDGAVLVPGVVYSASLPTPAAATKIAAGEITVGPSFFDLSGRDRGFQISHALGLGLALAIEDNAGARQRFGELWTNGRFQATDPQGRAVALDRFSVPEGIAQAYARLNAQDWRAHGALFPDAMRAVAIDANERGYPVPADVLAWARGGEIGGPTRTPSDPGAALAGRLAGLLPHDARSELERQGFWKASASTSTAPEAWRKVTDQGVTTITFPRDAPDTAALGASVDGSHTAWDARAGGPTVFTATALRGESGDDARRRLAQAGYTTLQMSYASGTRWQAYWNKERPDEVLWVGSQGAYPREQIVQARPDQLDPSLRPLVQARAIANDPLAAPVGTDRATLRSGLVRGGWQLSGDASDASRVWTAERVLRPNTETAEVQRVRFALGADGRIEQVGRPDDGEGFATPEAYTAIQQRLTQEHIAAWRARTERIRTVAEQIRSRVNRGSEPFDGGEDLATVQGAMRELGYVASAPRGLQGGGQSITFKNTRVGAKVIVRFGPEQDGVRRALANSRVQRGSVDFGRARVTGRLPQNVEEYAGDALGRGDEMKGAHGAQINDTRVVRFAQRGSRADFTSDHAGFHRGWEGLIMLGEATRPSLQRLLEARAAGRDLTPREMRDVYASYKLMQHEIHHGVRTGAMSYRPEDGGKGIEEALTEELAHVEMVDWMRSHGLDDVLAWARDQREQGSRTLTWPIQGSYLGYRSDFAQVLARMGPMTNEQKVALFRKWKFTMSGDDRKTDMARRIAAAQGTDFATERRWIERTMSGDQRRGTRVVRGFTPILEPDYSQVPRPRRVQPTGNPTSRLAADVPNGTLVRVSGRLGHWRIDGRTHSGAVVIRPVDRDGGREPLAVDHVVYVVNAGTEARPPTTPPVAPPPAPRPATSTVTPPAGAEHGFRVRDRVRVAPVRGRRFQGRVIEVGSGDRAGQVKVKKIGRGEEVWVHHSTVTNLDGTRPGGTTPPPPPSGTTPPVARPAARTAVPSQTLANGGVAAAGARVRGRVSGQLSTITSIAANGQITIRRDDGSTYTPRPDELDLVVINDQGRELKKGDAVRTPSGGADRIAAIRWTDPANPEVQLHGGTQWIAGRSLTPYQGHGSGGENALASIAGRSGRQVPVHVGTRVRWNGREVEVLGVRATNWPLAGQGVEIKDGQERRVVPVGDISPVGEPPTLQGRSVSVDSALRDRLGQAHYRRQATARRHAEALARPVSATVGDELAQWARSAGLPMRRPGGSPAGTPARPVYEGRATRPEDLFAHVYRDLFASQGDYDRIAAQNPKLLETVRGLASEAALPWPNWAERVPPAPPAPPVPPGTMYDRAVLKHAWSGTFGRRGFTATVTNVSARDGYASVQGVIRNAQGQQVGTFQRRVSRDTDGSPTVYHAYLAIDRGAQGGGFAAAFNRHAEGVYRAKGVKTVTVHANIDVGGYTWAATGFDFDASQSTPEARAKARARTAWNFYQYRQSRLTAAQRRVVEAALWDPHGSVPFDPNRHIHHAWDLAHLGGGDHAIGKAILLGQSWHGTKLLVGADRSPLAG